MSLTARQRAVMNKENTYYGAPCKHGHLGLRYVSKSQCIDCVRVQPRSTDKPEHKDRRRQWKRDHPEARQAERQRYLIRYAPWLAQRKAARAVARQAFNDIGKRISALGLALDRATKQIARDTARKAKAQTTKRQRSAIARQYQQQWKAERPEEYREYARAKRRKRAALERANGGRSTKAERMALLAEQGYACVYCDASERLELDHKTPVIRGGRGDIDNLQWLCAPCNNDKRDATDHEYRQRIGLPLLYAL